MLDIGRGPMCDAVSARWVLPAGVDAKGLRNGRRVTLHAVIEPINDTVIAAKARAAAYSGVQFGRSAVAQYMPPLPDCVRGQDARRPDSGFAQKRPSRTASRHRRARLLCSATGEMPKRVSYRAPGR
jgi:hypothetical protein